MRLARRTDVEVLAALIDGSVRELQQQTYTARQIDLALAHVYGVDTVLIDDGTYYVVEERRTGDGAGAIVACGGWSRRATLYGGDVFAGRSDDLLDPSRDAAKVRAFFVRPTHVRRGLASLLLEHCERAARAAGFARIELGATLAGVPFYAARGYAVSGPADVPLPDGERLPIVRMERRVS